MHGRPGSIRQRSIHPAVEADGAKAAAGRGGVARAQVRRGTAALVADAVVVHMVLHELFRSSTEALVR